jgi:Xaa-Pro aminopeptidase
MKKMYQTRLKRILSLLKDSGAPQALVLSSNSHAVRSRDTHFPYRQNSDLYYFTGTQHQELTLIVRPQAKEPITLVAPVEDPIKKVWEGEQPSAKALARTLGVELIASKDPLNTVRAMVRNCNTLYLQSQGGGVSSQLRQELAGRGTLNPRGLGPTIVDAERITAVLRSIKDPTEVDLIRKAADLTSAALLHIAQFIRSGIRERELAALIDYLYRLHGAEPSFNTIIASGRSAATLHYHALSKTLRDGELLLIDTGCELDMYASDVSRTIPVGDALSPPLEDIYTTVLEAQKKAIAAVKPGIYVSEVHRVAALEITRGLKELGILRGNVSALFQKGAYKPYFPHGIGHMLGIDVHDVTPEAGSKGLMLQKGMVITIEPGLYFSKPVGKIPACGVRIEDDVLVTSRGHEVLTANVFPKELDELRTMLG